MKKKLLTCLLVFLMSTACGLSFAKTTTSAELAESIKLYKAGNYSGCYAKLDDAIKKDPSNPLCYYYKAMSATQIGKKDEAIENYEKTISLSSQKSNLVKYAKKGKRCLETPEQCQESLYDNVDDMFIRSKGSAFSEEARSMYERLKIEQMMRDMNRQDDINPQKFREYKDFSSMNTPSDMPRDEEIVAAVKTLQKAGMLNFGNNTYSDLSLLTGSNNGAGGMMDFANMNPQLIQAMFTNNMSLGF